MFMQSFGEIIRGKRENAGLVLRQVAEALGIDQAIISKLERGERSPSKSQVEKFAMYYKLDKKSLMISWLSDQVANKMFHEDDGIEVLKVAEEKVRYLKMTGNEEKN